MRVALLTNILSPYRRPVYEALAATPDFELRVLLSAEGEFDRRWSFEAGVLDARVVRGFSFRLRNRTRTSEQVVTAHVPLGVIPELLRFRPDVVVSGELGARTLLARLYCVVFRRPLVIWSYHSRVSATVAGRARRALWRWLLSGASAVIGMGTQAREVLEELGVPSERIHDAPNAHEKPAEPQHGEKLRRELGLRRRVAMCVGRLIPSKGVEELLHAWAGLPGALRDEWSLCFVGDGPLAGAVAAAGAVRVPEVPFTELGEHYGLADLLVFPSLGEPWGLVVNEALACGVPVLCSRLAGCADDLVQPGASGWLFDPTEPEGFRRALQEALTSRERGRLGANGRRIAAGYSPQRMAEGMRRAVRAAASS